MATNTKDIKYLNKDFSQFRDNLINFTKVYFPNTYNDFNESDPGMMFIEMASYVGDTLSYYIDRQLKESLLAYAEEQANVYSLARSFGYKPKISVPATTEITVYQLLPAKTVGVDTVPDWDYALVIEPGMQVSSTVGNAGFICYDKIDFGFSSSLDKTQVSVYSSTGGVPDWYLIEKSASITAGNIKTIQVTFTDPIKFNSVLISDTNLIGIYDVYDADGNRWVETPYLAQETIFDEVPNTAENDPTLSQYAGTTQYLLRLKKVPKRFTTRITSNNNIELQFGSGVSSNQDEEIIVNPDNVGMALPVGRQTLDLAIDPSNFMYTNTYGEVPRNTTLTIRYLVGGGMISNSPANTITNIFNATISAAGTNQVTYSAVKKSLACTNPKPATGGAGSEPIENIRQNTMALFAAQNRAVSLPDYLVRVYSMPGKYGSIAKAHIVQDQKLNLYDLRNKLANPLALNLYTLGYDINKNLTTLNPATKQNLKTFLSQYKMLTDAINIKDAYIVNIQVAFEIITLASFNANEVLIASIQAVKDFFNIDRWQINQPIIISDVISTLLKVSGVQTVPSVVVYNVYGESRGYSNNYYDIKSATRNNIIYPSLDPCIFEVKYPNTDIQGRITTI